MTHDFPREKYVDETHEYARGHAEGNKPWGEGEFGGDPQNSEKNREEYPDDDAEKPIM